MQSSDLKQENIVIEKPVMFINDEYFSVNFNVRKHGKNTIYEDLRPWEVAKKLLLILLHVNNVGTHFDVIFVPCRLCCIVYKYCQQFRYHPNFYRYTKNGCEK